MMMELTKELLPRELSKLLLGVELSTGRTTLTIADPE
jgi:hypothetical protein